MDNVITATFLNLTDAEAAARQLVERGVPASCIHMREATEPGAEMPAYGVSLGGGVGVDATESLIEVHEGEPMAASEATVYVVSVETMGDPNRMAASHEVFGQR